MKKILIIGGAGFIGFHLANNLSNNNEVHLLDNFQRGKKDISLTNLIAKGNVELLNYDLMDEKVADLLSHEYDFIFQLAAIVGVQNVIDQPYQVLYKNFLINHNALLLAEKQSKLRSFIFASTSEVQSNSANHFDMPFPTSENFPICLPDLKEERSSYMLSKVYGEAMCYQKNIPSIILRPHNIYGPRMGMSHVIPEIMYKIYSANKNTTIDVKSPKHMRAFCYVDDAVMLMEKLVNKAEDCHLNNAYNIGNSNEEVTIEELVKILLEVADRKDLNIFPSEDTKGSPSRRCPDISKTTSITQIGPKINLLEGCKLTWEWYRETF